MSLDPSTGTSTTTYAPPPKPPSAASATGATSATTSGRVASTPSAPSAPLGADAIVASPARVLGPGSRGAGVATLQRLVGATSDGIYGPKTTAAVAGFQAAHGLTPDGIVGAKTWSALTGDEKTLGPGARGPAVASLQRLVGAVPDGVYGPKTAAAVSAYQGAHGLGRDGIATSQTWRSLVAGAPAFTNLGTPAAKPSATPSLGASAPKSAPPAPSRASTPTPAVLPSPAIPPAPANAASAKHDDNALVAAGHDYLDKLQSYMTKPINDAKTAASIAGKFARRDFEALSNAAAANTQFADKIRSVVNDFNAKPASEIDSAIRGLLDDVKGGKQTFAAPSAVGNAAQKLGEANRVPAAAEALGAKVGGVVDGATASARDALENAPGPLRGLGRWASKKLGDVVDSAKASVASAYRESSLKQLPDDAKSLADDAASTLENTAAAQSAKASSPLLKTLKALGTTPDDLTAGSKIPVLGNVPILSLATTAYSTVNDAKKVGTADSVAANVGSMFASQLGGRAVQNALVDGLGSAAETTVGEAAGSTLAGVAGEAALAGGAEVAGDALVGAAVASGPAGWAILAGVGAGIAIGVGVKDVVESKAGQDIINGAFSGNLDQVGKGFGEAGQDVVDLGKGAVSLGSSALHGAEHLGGDAIDAGKKALDSIGSFLGL